jgi:LAGLIDADG endonuclease
LGIGNIYISKTNPAVTYNVVNKDGILIILAIFAKYNLNTTKHLNFLALAQAFWLYRVSGEPKGPPKRDKTRNR